MDTALPCTTLERTPAWGAQSPTDAISSLSATISYSIQPRSYLLMMFSCSGFSLTSGDFFFFPFTTGGCTSGQNSVREKDIRALGSMPTKHWGQSYRSPQCLGMVRVGWYLHQAWRFLRILLRSLSPGHLWYLLPLPRLVLSLPGDKTEFTPLRPSRRCLQQTPWWWK